MTYEQAQGLKRGDEVWYIDEDGGDGPVIIKCEPSEVDL